MDNFSIVGLPNPDWGYALEPDADVIEVKFGDGYVFREPKGLNHLKERLSPKWSTLEPEQGRAGYNFLKPKLKLIPFLYTDYISGITYKVICTAVSLTFDDFNNAVLNASLEQDFNP